MYAHEKAPDLVVFWHSCSCCLEVVVTFLVHRDVSSPVEAVLFTAVESVKDLVVGRIAERLVLGVPEVVRRQG
jgi:hypothetical protein